MFYFQEFKLVLYRDVHTYNKTGVNILKKPVLIKQHQSRLSRHTPNALLFTQNSVLLISDHNSLPACEAIFWKCSQFFHFHPLVPDKKVQIAFGTIRLHTVCILHGTILNFGIGVVGNITRVLAQFCQLWSQY